MNKIKKHITIVLFSFSICYLIAATLPSQIKNKVLKLNNSILYIDRHEEFYEEIYNSKITKGLKRSRKKVKYITKAKLLAHIAKTESSDNYSAASKRQFVGKYQASKSALLEFGYSEDYINSIYSSIDTNVNEKGKVYYTFNTSLFPPSEQERFIRWFMHHMESTYLKQSIQKYVGKEINGINITRAGILNASMLGFSNVIKYLESNGKINYAPRSGPSIKTRLKQFEKLDISNK